MGCHVGQHHSEPFADGNAHKLGPLWFSVNILDWKPEASTGSVEGDETSAHTELSRAWPGLIGSGSSGVGSGWHQAFYYRTLEKG